MVAGFLSRFRKRSRKYPIKRDEFGESARQLCFNAFDRGLRPAQVAREAEISLRTACRYFADWKRQPQKLELRYRMLKAALKSHPGLREEITARLAAELGISEEQVSARLQKPWALKQLVTGEWRKWKAEEKRRPKGRANNGRLVSA